MLKRIACFSIITLVLVFLLCPVSLFADDRRVTVYFFWSLTCPHCRDEKVFLSQVRQKYPYVEIKDFEVSANAENARLFMKVSEKLGNDRAYVPLLVVGDQDVLGFYNAETTGAKIENLIEHAYEHQCPDVVAAILNPEPPVSPIPTGPACSDDSGDEMGEVTSVNFPFLGELRLKSLSLPTLSIVLGLLDGFNPCAMWALLFLISLLLGMRNGIRRWILGTAFIVTSTVVYFLFMSAWLNLFLFLGFVTWIRIIIGVVAVGIAGYSLQDYWRNREGVCKVSGGEIKGKVIGRLREIVEGRKFIAALIGIVLLAFAVNLIELICSAGFPAVYTHVLSLSHLSTAQYYLYLLVYIFFFMLDDLFVFFVAMITLHAVGIEGKYARYSRLIGGILILIIGLLLLLKPQWLMFG